LDFGEQVRELFQVIAWEYEEFKIFSCLPWKLILTKVKRPVLTDNRAFPDHVKGTWITISFHVNLYLTGCYYYYIGALGASAEYLGVWLDIQGIQSVMELFQGLGIEVLEVVNLPQSFDLLSLPIIVVVFLGEFLEAILNFREVGYELLEYFKREHANSAVVFCSDWCSARCAIEQRNFTKYRTRPNLLNKVFIFAKLTTNYQNVCLPLLQNEQMSASWSLSYDVLVCVELSCLNVIKNKVINFHHPRENWVLLYCFQEEMFLDLGFKAHWQFGKQWIYIFPLKIAFVSFIQMLKDILLDLSA